MNNQIANLKRNIFDKAKIFIEDMGCFAPFGAKVSQDELVDIMAYEDFEDSIDGTILIKLMKDDILKSFEKNAINIGAIAYDVVINMDDADGLQVKRDALCLIYTNDGRSWIDEYYPYMLIDNHCIWK
ncbi:hypothetical protein PN465_21180 [Nodularia spumigena CS-584]|nr:hypothetical protein [Nodularia spumigena CS-584]